MAYFIFFFLLPAFKNIRTTEIIVNVSYNHIRYIMIMYCCDKRLDKQFVIFWWVYIKTLFSYNFMRDARSKVVNDTDW